MTAQCNFVARLFCVIISICSAIGQTITSNIQSVTPPSGTLASPLYIIDSDASNNAAGYERDAFTVSVPVRFSKNSLDASNTDKFRVSIQLFDSNDNVVTLQGGATTVNSAEQSVTVTTLFPNVTQTFAITVDPGVDLGAGKNYYVKATCQGEEFRFVGSLFLPFWVNRDGPDSSSSFTVVHFTNTASGDAAFNARGYPTGTPNWARIYSLIPDSGANNNFRVDVPYFMARYDLGGATTNLSVRLTATLIDDVGTIIPLQNGGAFTSTISMPSMLTGGGLPNRPRVLSGNLPCLFAPVSQLDSVGRTYRVKITMEHIEIPASTYLSDGSTENTTLTRLLHFNGNLSFGPLDTNFNSLTNTPSPGTLGAGHITTTITVGDNGGSIPGFPSYTFGNGVANLSVQLLTNGNCVVTAGTQPLAVSGGGTVSATYGGVRVQYPSVVLQSVGPVAASVAVQLPQGLGYNPDRAAQAMRYEPVFTFTGSRTLNASFRHSGNLSAPTAADSWVFDESRTLLYKVMNCEFATTGVISFQSDKNEWIHTGAVEQLETQQSLGQHQLPSMSQRLNNEGYLRYVESSGTQRIDFKAAPDGTARTSQAEMRTVAGSFFTHMPYETKIRWSDSGTYKISDGNISGQLENAKNFIVSYDAACSNSACGPSGSVNRSLQSNTLKDNQFIFSPDGGFYAAGDISPEKLEWGFKGDSMGGAGAPTHVTDAFVKFSFFAPGNQIYDDKNPLGGAPSMRSARAASCILLSGFSPSSGMVYPEKTPYINGVGSYAGMNFVQETGNPDQGGSAIADMPTISPYTLQEVVSKYYVRTSGISGRQVAEVGTFSSAAVLYDYAFKFSRFQLTFLSDVNEDSWVNGSINVPFPSDFSQKFEELKIGCTGALESALIDPTDVGEKNLRYWKGKFTPLTLRFAKKSGASCYAPRCLTIGLTTGAANIPTPLSGVLGFLPSGDIAKLGDNIDGTDGRLGLPAKVFMEGPGKELYHLVPASKLYFNSYFAAGRPDDGYVGFGATCNVPFFEDLKLHVMTSAQSSAVANIYLTGGWTEGGQTFFSNQNFDSGHRAFPPASAGINVTDYQRPEVENAFVPRAKQSIFGLIDLDYPMQWDVSGRFFVTWGGDREVDLFVVDVQHQVTYLSANNAEITFGVQYEGIPKINLASAVFDAAEEQIGAVKALVDGASKEITSVLYRGVDELGNLVKDNIEVLLDDALDGIEDDVIDPLYVQLKSTIESLEGGATTYNDFADQTSGQLKTLLDAKFNTAGAGVATVQNRINELSSAIGTASSVLTRIDNALADGENAINSIVDEIEQTRNEAGQLINIPDGPRKGILSRDSDGKRDIVQRLLEQLLRELAPKGLGDELFGSLTEGLSAAVNEQLGGLLEEADPALDRIVEVLTQARDFIKEVREQLKGAGDLIQEFQAILAGATSEITGIINDVRAKTFDFLDDVAAAARINTQPLSAARSLLDEFSKEEFVAFIKGQIRDELLEALFVQQIQSTLRGFISDLEVSMNSAIDSMFSQVTNLCKEVINEFLGPIDDAINGLAGDINQYVGAGSLDGYAHIEGDTLRRLRIDAEVSIKVPDEMALKGFFEYNCYDSTTEGAACVAPGTSTVEIKVGAIDAPLDWVNPGVKADLTVWFTMAVRSSPSPGQAPIYPRGIGGSLEMTAGEINFESLKIKKFAAAVAVGLDDCYLAATATVIISSYEATGGIFFGRSCSIAPLEMVDPDVAAVLGPAPFIGAYVYGEVWIPISEVVLGIPASCLFQISAGVGAGAFFFISGPNDTPTFGGKMLLGVSGEALCVVSIRGEVKMVGVMSGSSLRFSGTGTLSGKAGPCPLCVKFKESVKVTFQDGKFSID